MYILRLLLLSLMAMLFVSLSALAQDFNRERGTIDNPYHVYMVLWRGETEIEKGFEEYFKDRGIAVKLTVRNLNRDSSLAVGFIDEVKTLRPDLVYTWGTSTTLAMWGRYDIKPDQRSKFLSGVPGVFTLVAYPSISGIIPDFHEPRDDLTGVRFLPDIATQVGVIRAYMAPEKELKTLAVLFNPLEKNSRINVEVLRAYTSENGITLLEKPVPIATAINEESGKIQAKPDRTQIPELIRQVKEAGADFIYMGADSFLLRIAEIYTGAAVKYKLPVFSATEAPIKKKDSFVLFSLTSSYYNLGQLTAYQAEQILIKGRSPKDVPIRSLSEFNLLLNRDTMRKIGYFPPIKILMDAEIVSTESSL